MFWKMSSRPLGSARRRRAIQRGCGVSDFRSTTDPTLTCAAYVSSAEHFGRRLAIAAMSAFADRSPIADSPESTNIGHSFSTSPARRAEILFALRDAKVPAHRRSYPSVDHSHFPTSRHAAMPPMLFEIVSKTMIRRDIRGGKVPLANFTSMRHTHEVREARLRKHDITEGWANTELHKFAQSA